MEEHNRRTDTLFEAVPGSGGLLIKEPTMPLEARLIAATFGVNFALGKSRGRRIKRFPSRILIKLSQLDCVDRPAREDLLCSSTMFVVGLCGNHRSAAADRFGIEVGIALVDTGCHEGTGDPAHCGAGSAARDGTDCCCNEPTSGHHRTYTRDGQHAQAGKSTSRAAGDAADSSARPCTWAGIRCRYRFLGAIDVISDEADISSWDTRGFKIANRLRGIVKAIEYSRNWSCGHD